MKLAWIARLVIAALALALLAPASTAAAGEDGEKKSTTFAGTVDGTDAYIGIVVTKGEDTARVYVCDSSGLTHWFQPDVSQKGKALSGVSPGGAVLVARLEGKAFEGNLVLPGGETHEFTAPRAKGDAGLYRLEQAVGTEQYSAGWVVLPDGSFRGDVTRTGLPSPFDGTTTEQSPPPPTEAPATTTTVPAPTTAPPGEIALPGVEQGKPAPPDIETQFPPDPPPDAQVLSATAEGDVTVGGDTTVSTEPGATTTTAAAVPLKFTSAECKIIADAISVLNDFIDTTFKGRQTDRKKADRAGYIAAQNEMSRGAVAGGCAAEDFGL